MRYLFLFLLFSTSPIFGQKQDYIWQVHHFCGSILAEQHTQLDFNTAVPTQTIVTSPLCLNATSAAICDEAGNLLLYTNGKAIANFSHDIIENGDSINYGYWYEEPDYAGYPLSQGAFFIQKPAYENVFYLFHMYYSDLVPSTIPYMSPRYSIIDINENNGHGKVVEKNVSLLVGSPSLNYGQSCAVRHANGRDWWIIAPSHMGPEYYRFLLSPTGIQGPWVQEIGFREYTSNILSYAWGYRTFSPDGSKFVDYYFDYGNPTELFDFDRCTGLFSNARLLEHEQDSVLNNVAGSVAFSPSGRFLYLARTDQGYSLFQYDTEASDILASEVEIYHCSYVNQQPECILGNMRLAPDGKIYVGAADWYSFSIIHEPDSLGLACNFELGGLVFSILGPQGFFPYTPNYRLGALEGSPCDSIEVSPAKEPVSSPVAVQLHPNPASDQIHLHIEMPEAFRGHLLFFDVSGKEAMRCGVQGGSNRLSVGGLPPGIYLYEVRDGERRLGAGKLVRVE